MQEGPVAWAQLAYKYVLVRVGLRLYKSTEVHDYLTNACTLICYTGQMQINGNAEKQAHRYQVQNRWRRHVRRRRWPLSGSSTRRSWPPKELVVPIHDCWP